RRSTKYPLGDIPLIVLSAGVHRYPKGANVSAEDMAKEKERLQADLRSEEHTSELQSRFDLVCRLLLEKKKNSDSNTTSQSIRSTSPTFTRNLPQGNSPSRRSSGQLRPSNSKPPMTAHPHDTTLRQNHP